MKENKKLKYCSCNQCGETLLVKDCETKEDSEGWEYEPYYYHVCPVCMKAGKGEGDITDYFEEVLDE